MLRIATARLVICLTARAGTDLSSSKEVAGNPSALFSQPAGVTLAQSSAHFSC